MLGLTGLGAQRAIGGAAIVALTVVNAFGVRPGKWTQNVLSVTKLAVFAGLLAARARW